MRKIFVILGAIIALLAAGGVYLFMQLSRPSVTEVPVAASEIIAGTVLNSSLFRITRVSNIEPEALAKWVTLNEWRMAEGKVSTSDIHEGFPVAKVQIDPESTAEGEKRLSIVLTGTKEYYAVIPTSPNEVGNFVQTGDRVDLFISLGSMDKRDVIEISPNTAAPAAGGTTAGTTLTHTETPVSKLVMQNMVVIRVERDAAKSSGSSSNQTAGQTTYTPGDVKRLYVKVNRDQAEVLNFVVNSGKRSIMVRAYTADNENVPTDGVTWEDFARWFFAQRGTATVQPFDAASPSKPATSGK